MKRFSTSMAVCCLVWWGTSISAEESRVHFESHYLVPTVAGYHHYELRGDLGGKGQLVLNPNACTLDPFGDPGICTLIAPTVRDVKLAQLEILDPTGQGRTLYAIDGHGLDGDLRLVVTKGQQDAWFVLTNRAGERMIIAMDRREPNARSSNDKRDKSCTPLAKTVDGVAAQAKLVPGFVNGTWFVVLAGKKTNLGTTIVFEPVVYVRQPEYWEIRVHECSSGLTTPLISPYVATHDVSATLGTKGVDLVFADGTIRLQLP